MKVSICCIVMTTKNSEFKGIQEGLKSFDLLLFNCPCCGSTKAKKVSKRKKVSNAQKTIRKRAA